MPIIVGGMKRVIILTLIALVATAAVAVSQIQRPSPISPKNGASFRVGTTPTFKFRAAGSGERWVHVSRSSRRDSQGVIKPVQAAFGRAKRVRGNVYRFKPKHYDYSGSWSNQRRTYYWQAYRISCGEEDTTNDDCRVEGPIRRFRLR